MNTIKNSGRIVGVLLLLQFLLMFLAFYPLAPAVTSDYLNVAGGMEGTIRMAVIALLVSSGLTMGMALMAFPVLKQHSMRTAIWVVAMATIWIVVQSIDSAHILSMLALSKQFAASAGAGADIYAIVGPQVRSTRGFVHYTQLLAIDVWFASLYAALFAFRLVPRPVSAIALVTLALHAIGLPIAMFAGYPIVLNFAYGIIVSYLLVGGWLVAKGFREPADLSP